MGEFLDRPARLSLSLREREGNVGITPDNYQILPPSSNHIYTHGSSPKGWYFGSRLSVFLDEG
jgi:hypothetical protein